ncbi:hypothetical protein BAUCODRAFT_318798 [Baudoinia panamericana UAMH 10762]|uniref:Uncharacterized protein n=1 Tax=Baudoinia panamericana (strain UAMH 10762) TaxID=717646 RepID=M2MX48_BAUPA|nr:uncharacterized protein BAUCODRAFT_318798 [Baudoinia panamericana UAMH 10762]EMC91219.1 hypothetical protein BAUCODRAFT_318798 [Baudoinia panamericana UAMH 10762]
MTASTPSKLSYSSVDPQPRDPGTGRSPQRPRPGKPVQPRDEDGRHIRIDQGFYGSNNGTNGGGRPPQPIPPRDPGSRRRLLGPQPREDGSNRCFSGSQPIRKPKPVQPREGGTK